MSHDGMIILWCAGAHKKIVSQAYWLEWKSRHGPGTVMLCKKCNEVLLPEGEIPEPHLQSIKQDWKDN